MSHQIYLDHAATTPLRQEAREAMEPFLGELYANPSSVYRLAQASRSALDHARDVVAECIGATSSEIIFTGGATESINAAIKGAALARANTHSHIVTTAVEHHAVLHPVEELTERFGFQSTTVPVGSSGIVDPIAIERALRADTCLVSVMWANNEIGTLQPIADIATIVRARGVLLHVDAVQAASYVPIDLRTVDVDMLSLSAHKFSGPKGVGLLYLRRGTPWWPLITGGGQERNRRAGTENVAGIIGMAKALQLACEERAEACAHAGAIRDYLYQEIGVRISGVYLNGDADSRLPNNLNLSFEGVHGEALLVGLDLAGIMASSGSACTSGTLEPSHVLQAIGVPDDLARSSLRLTVGRENSMHDMERVVDTLHQLVGRLRQLAPASTEVRRVL